MNKILEFWDKIDKHAKIGIRGAGKHTVCLLNQVGHAEKNIVGIFDSNKAYEDQLPYPIYTVDQISEKEVEVMIISSFAYRFEMLEEMKSFYPNILCIDMYKSINRPYNAPFYEFAMKEDYEKFDNDLKKYKELNAGKKEFEIDDDLENPCLTDWRAAAGTLGSDLYLQQDLWGAKKVFEARPKTHWDIGSRIDGFITHLLSFKTRVTLIDIRKYENSFDENLLFIQEDATTLARFEDNSIDSLSALCSIEHFGLGRYGDEVDPDAVFIALKNMQRVVCPNGNFYISVPVGSSNQLSFNAHRVFNPQTITQALDEMELIEFSCATSNGLYENQDPTPNAHAILENGVDPKQASIYGLFHFKKQAK